MSKTIYEGNYVKLIEEVLGKDLYEKVFTRDAVIIFPFKNMEEIYMIKEKRVHEGVTRIKPVTGFIDDGDDWELTADKELQEEIQLKAKSYKLIKHLKQRGTINTDRYFVIATDLDPSPTKNPDGDVVEEILTFKLEEIIQLSLSGEIPITFDTIGIFLLKEYLKANPLS